MFYVFPYPRKFGSTQTRYVNGTATLNFESARPYTCSKRPTHVSVRPPPPRLYFRSKHPTHVAFRIVPADVTFRHAPTHFTVRITPLILPFATPHLSCRSNVQTAHLCYPSKLETAHRCYRSNPQTAHLRYRSKLREPGLDPRYRRPQAPLGSRDSPSLIRRLWGSTDKRRLRRKQPLVWSRPAGDRSGVCGVPGRVLIHVLKSTCWSVPV